MIFSPQGKLISLILLYIIIILSNLSITFIILIFFIILSIIFYKNILYLFHLFIFILFFTFIISFYNIIFIKTGDLLFSIANINIYSDAVYFILSITTTVSTLFIVTNFFIKSMNNSEFIYGLQVLLSPFKFVGINVNKFTIILMLSIKFIPILIEELLIIKKAQFIRGINSLSKNPINMIKSFIPIIIPLFIISMNKSEKLGKALDLKLYNANNNRTSYFNYKFNLNDFLLIILLLYIIIKK